MELLFVGTGAADYETALTCPCPTCVYARHHGGRNLRTYASLLVDGAVLIDCGATVPWRLAELHADPGEVSHLLITHAHEDHLAPAAVASLTMARRARERVAVFGNDSVVRVLAQSGVDAELNAVRPGEAVRVGPLEALALPATHDWDNQVSLNWAVGREDDWLVYAADTAWPGDLWWALLSGRSLSAAVIEATFGPLDSDAHPDCLTHHLNWESFGRLVSELRGRGILAPGAPALATHISQHFVPPHDESAPVVESLGGVLAYDGLRLTL